jgi:hypothetical protein
MGQAKVARVAGLTKRDLGTTYHVTVTNADGSGNFKQLNSATSTARFVRTKTNVTEIAAYVATYPNNTTKAGWVNGVSPKNR